MQHEHRVLAALCTPNAGTGSNIMLEVETRSLPVSALQAPEPIEHMDLLGAWDQFEMHTRERLTAVLKVPRAGSNMLWICSNTNIPRIPVPASQVSGLVQT